MSCKSCFWRANNIFAAATLATWPQLHSFSIGLENSPDLLAARKAANYLGTVHREYVFTVQEGLDAIPEVIYHLETYDVTTVRASTPMYLLSRKIKAMGVKMVLSGEGSDEIFGGMILFYFPIIYTHSDHILFPLGYLYFHAAPDKVSFHQESVRRVKNLHTSDCLRANKYVSNLFLIKEFEILKQNLKKIYNGMGVGGTGAVPG